MGMQLVVPRQHSNSNVCRPLDTVQVSSSWLSGIAEP